VSISGAPWKTGLSQPSCSRFDISSASMRSFAFLNASRPRTLHTTTRSALGRRKGAFQPPESCWTDPHEIVECFCSNMATPDVK
jgi:hypothetical protein